MSSLKGFLLVPTQKNKDTGLWFIFHHEEDGILAFDITTEHPEIPYRHFENALNGVDLKDPKDKIVLLGGPMQPDSAMLVLHNKPDPGSDQHIISRDFAFKSYRFVLLPGKPPAITNADNAPTRLTVEPSADFIVTIGFRLWEMDALEAELKDWQWTLLPATREIVFQTSRESRLERARRTIN